MLSYSNGLANKYERFYMKIHDLSWNQLDANNQYKTSFKFEKNLVQLGHLQKVIIPSIPVDGFPQPSLIIDYARISKRAPVSKKSKVLSKIVSK
jgi:hypothetical protein